MKKPIPRAPAELQTKEAKRLWYDIQRDFEIEPDSREILRVAVMSLDEYLTANETMRTEGNTFKTTTGQIRKHPLHEISKTARMAFLSAMRDLGIDYNPKEKRKPGRPSESWY